ncbi:PQQ-binding-like beta-propeller repeat protein (plasmid) [Salinirubellus salinus]|uniref:PQQ-binding-like beta-propeller repeat protein n=1 Tax=Salinirubellus salinus TaxID=1364945 RepID=A0A9E7R6Q5_9EURY|nr:PQQ-binding-like beta-propeller repeat protein [Salinirubellus salinus]UWM56945.1 PQQ-binding-like beta-propeller repeat protein [Salinirubellus salinus]
MDKNQGGGRPNSWNSVSRRNIVTSAGGLALLSSVGVVESVNAKSRNRTTSEGSVSQPTLNNDASGPTVYVSLGDRLVAIDAISGDEVWEAQIEAGDTGINTPTVVNGTVYVTHKNFIYAFDAVSGEREWVFENDIPNPFLDSLAITLVDDILYLGNRGGFEFSDRAHILALDVTTQSVVWKSKKYRVDEDTTRGVWTFSPVFVEDGEVYVAGVFGNLFVINRESGEIIERIDNFDEGDVQMSLITKSSNNIYTAPIDTDEIASVDVPSMEINWRYVLEDAIRVESPIIDEEFIYYFITTSEGPQVYILNKDGTLHNRLSLRQDSRIVLENNELYILGESSIKRINPQNTAEQIEYNLSKVNQGGTTLGSLATILDGFIFSSGGGSICCLALQSNDDGDDVSDLGGRILWEYEPSLESYSSSIPTIVANPQSGSSVGARTGEGFTGQYPGKTVESTNPLEQLRQKALSAFESDNDVDSTPDASSDDQSSTKTETATPTPTPTETPTATPTPSDTPTPTSTPNYASDTTVTEQNNELGDDGTGPTQTTSGQMPGFGVPTAIAALGGISYILYSRSRSNDAENEGP